MLKVGVPGFTQVPQLLVYNHLKIRPAFTTKAGLIWFIGLLYRRMDTLFSAQWIRYNKLRKKKNG